MHDLTARYASGWNMAGGGMDPAAMKDKYEAFATACQGSGAVKDFGVSKMTFLAVAQDAAGARRMVDELATKSNLAPEVFTTERWWLRRTASLRTCVR